MRSSSSHPLLSDGEDFIRSSSVPACPSHAAVNVPVLFHLCWMTQSVFFSFLNRVSSAAGHFIKGGLVRCWGHREATATGKSKKGQKTRLKWWWNTFFVCWRRCQTLLRSKWNINGQLPMALAFKMMGENKLKKKKNWAFPDARTVQWHCLSALKPIQLLVVHIGSRLFNSQPADGMEVLQEECYLWSNSLCTYVSFRASFQVYTSKNKTPSCTLAALFTASAD